MFIECLLYAKLNIDTFRAENQSIHRTIETVLGIDTHNHGGEKNVPWGLEFLQAKGSSQLLHPTDVCVCVCVMRAHKQAQTRVYACGQVDAHCFSLPACGAWY